MIEDIIQAVSLEEQRIEDPRNRSRYFIFGKTDEFEADEFLGFSFESAPDRVLRDARWVGPRQEESLFRVGGRFISGFMAPSGGGVTVAFPLEEIAFHGLEPGWLRSAADRGIEYVMDSRELNGYLLDFLEGRRDTENTLLEGILSDHTPAAISPIAETIEYRDLNTSQKNAIQKALSQKVTFVWGPPGTGKTNTMAALAACLIKSKKRVLLSALSNMALDQLLLSTLSRLDDDTSNVTIARTGTHMNRSCRAYSRKMFKDAGFGAQRGGSTWNEHVGRASLVAANFAMLTFPRAPDPGTFDYVIADEISMANVPGLSAASYFGHTGIVLGGDPFQLPPIYPEDADVPNEWYRRNVFEMAGITDRHDPRVAFLDTQYRMQKEIGDLVSDLFYDNELKTGTTPVPTIPDYDARVAFLHTPGPVQYVDDAAAGVDEQRRFNGTHADAVVDTVLALLDSGVAADEIGVITPYNAQVVMILERLRVMGEGRRSTAGQAKVSTIHSFQGQERRVIIVDFTDDNVAPTRLTARWELINVALSRAREQLIIVGNRYYLTDDEYFKPSEIAVFERMLDHAVIMG
jgi:DNA replication ATP-dependent helicase Dna2